MEPEIQLILHNISWIVSIIIIFGVILFLLLNQKKDEATVAVIGVLASLAIFIISHVIGVNTEDPRLSRQILMGNFIIFFIASFNFHTAVAFLGKAREMRWTIAIVHFAAVALSAYFLAFPSTFLLDSVPKMYFPGYYNPGSLNIIRLLFLYGTMFPISVSMLIIGYYNAISNEKRNQLKYLALAMIGGHVIGFFPNFLVYDIKIDPLWGTPTAFILAVPLLYGAIRYGLFSVKSVAKQTIFFSLAVIFLSAFIAFFNYINGLIMAFYPGFPSWILPFFVSVLTVFLALTIWRKLRATDMLKYEFLTTMTHKLRTPLTGIRWAVESLSAVERSEDAKNLLRSIKDENSRLIRLTEALMRVSENENADYQYKTDKNDLKVMAEEAIDMISPQLKEKVITLKKEPYQSVFVVCDLAMTRFVLQVLIENAVRYSPPASEIVVSIIERGGHGVFSIRDRGIGISKADMDKLFSKFFRSGSAKVTYTEGMGIGLFMAKEIVVRQHGKIWVESEGENKGATFYFSLPLAK